MERLLQSFPKITEVVSKTNVIAIIIANGLLDPGHIGGNSGKALLATA